MIRFFTFANASHLNELLNQPNPNLEEILDEECVLNEVRNSNHRLISFLCRRETFDSLIAYVTEIPNNMPYHPNESRKDEKVNKYPYVACEILSTENDTLAQYFLGLVADSKLRDIDTDTIPDDTEIERTESMNIENLKEVQPNRERQESINEDTQMDIELMPPIVKFLRLMNSAPPLNPTVAGYFAKILKNIFFFKPAHMSTILYEGHFKYLQRMAINLYSDSLPEIFSLIFKLEGAYFQTDTKEYFVEKRHKLIQQVILNMFEKPKPEFPDDLFLDLQMNSSSLLVHLVVNIENILKGHEVLSPLFHTDVLNKLVQGLSDPALFAPISPVITGLCEYYVHLMTASQEGTPINGTPASQAGIVLNESFITAIIGSLDVIAASLRVENKDVNPQATPFQYGESLFCFGKIRISMLDLLFSYIKLKNENLSLKVIELGILSMLLELFVKNPWNNILHATLFRILSFILTNGTESLIRALFEQAKILEFILEALKQSEYQIPSKAAGRVNKGYSSYMFLISNVIEDLKYNEIQAYCNSHQAWQIFKNNDLRLNNERNTTRLGGYEVLSETVSFSGFPRTTYYTGETEAPQQNEQTDLNEAQYVGSEEEIKLDSEVHAVQNEEYHNNYINSFNNNEQRGDIENASPTSNGEFRDHDIQERQDSEVKFPKSVLIKSKLMNETEGESSVINKSSENVETDPNENSNVGEIQELNKISQNMSEHHS